jgi:TRAP-type C4-dicarboxylate transport system permease small subunit
VLLVTFHEVMLRLLGSESIPGSTLIPRTLLSIAEIFGIGYTSLLNYNVAIPSFVIEESMTANSIGLVFRFLFFTVFLAGNENPRKDSTEVLLEEDEDV